MYAMTVRDEKGKESRLEGAATDDELVLTGPAKDKTVFLRIE